MGSNQEKIKEALERIDKGLATINSDEDWLSFLRFQASFYNYSFGNTMLIYLQNPEATFVKGFKAWNKLGRYVRKGEKGIAILAPCFRKVTEFKEPEDKTVYHDEAGEKEEKRVIGGFRIAYVFDLATGAIIYIDEANTVNLLPLPGSLSQEIVPPWACTMALAMESPMPVPPVFRALDLSVR